MPYLGRGVDLKDEDEVKDYLENLSIEYRFGCYKERNPKACHLLGDFMESINKDFERAFQIYKTNCLDYDHSHSCAKVAGYKSKGRACKKDWDDAYDFTVRACNLGHFRSCLNAGILNCFDEKSSQYPLTRAPDRKKGLGYLKKACDEGELADACFRYSAQFIQGMKTTDNCSEEAFSYALKACNLGSIEGCVNLSVMYDKGDGIPADQEKARYYRKIAQDMHRQVTEPMNQLKFGETS